MKYAIGLDCGVASVGYAVMALNENDEPCRIIRLGSRVFETAEQPKTGESLAAPRREARSMRRRIRRHQHRLERIRQLIINENILTAEELDNLFSGKLQDIYELRTKALDEPVDRFAFARILIHLAQRRGFKSNRKSEKQTKEDGAILKAVQANMALLQNKGYRTVGELFYKDDAYAQAKRNKGEDYKSTVTRDMIEHEARCIFASQRAFGNDFASEIIEKKYLDDEDIDGIKKYSILLSQRSYNMGPASGPYSGNQIERMVGTCTLIPGEVRAPKASYSFQLFNLWQKINNITLQTEDGKVHLNDEQRKTVFELCHGAEKVTFAHIRRKLHLPENVLFTAVSYRNGMDDAENNAKFMYLDAYYEIKRVLNKLAKNYIAGVALEDIDVMATALTYYKTDVDIKNYLTNHGIADTVAAYLITAKNFEGFGHISVKACRMLLPFLEQGMTYDKACEAAGLDFKAHSNDGRGLLLPANAEELEDITSPVVRRAVSQTIKVVNSIIREQGNSPTFLNIELARELSKDFRERLDVRKHQESNQAENDRRMERLRTEFHVHNPTGMDLLKLRLWEEQDGICPYTQTRIEIEHLFDNGYTDIDHIVPYSISFDDSLVNKVLTFAKENRQKGNRLPLQYLSGQRKEAYVVWVNANVKNYRKRQKLLQEQISEEETRGFRERNLNDTRYISRFLLNYINDHLSFEAFEGNERRKKHVTSVNGAITAYMRKRWGIAKVRADGDLHHAADAAVIACTTDGLIQKVSDYTKRRELEYTVADDGGSYAVDNRSGEVVARFPQPYPEFRKELSLRLVPNAKERISEAGLQNYDAFDINAVTDVFVSRMPNHKVTGAAHKDTISSGKEPGYVISRVPLSALKLKNGEIENYYMPESDMLLYNALKARLAQFDGNGKAAFPQGFEFRKPLGKGQIGPVVQKVKIREKASSTVRARGDYGVAVNDSMVRADVFYVEGDGYYFVPVYVADTVKPELPNLACVSKKEWKPMREEDFCFSLYKNDLVKIKSRSLITLKLQQKDSTREPTVSSNTFFLYYSGSDISTASMAFDSADNCYGCRGLGIKRLEYIEKYTVDPLGKVEKVQKEQRRRFR